MRLYGFDVIRRVLFEEETTTTKKKHTHKFPREKDEKDDLFHVSFEEYQHFIAIRIGVEGVDEAERAHTQQVDRDRCPLPGSVWWLCVNEKIYLK